MVTDLEADKFDKEVLGAEQPVMVDFYSTYCEPCKRLAPIIDELAEEYSDELKVVKFNIDDGVEIAGRYGIMGVPAVFFFRSGDIVERLSGFKPKDTLKKSIESIIAIEDEEEDDEEEKEKKE